MPTARTFLPSAMAALALLLSPGASQAQSLPTPSCAWQFEWAPSGLGNWLIPDTGNRWWYMPIGHLRCGALHREFESLQPG